MSDDRIERYSQLLAKAERERDEACVELIAERDQTRAAVVKALRTLGNREEMPHDVLAFSTGTDRMEIARWLDERADAIKNGADW